MSVKRMQILRRMIQKKYRIFKVQPIVNRFKKKCKFHEKKGKYFIIQISEKPRGALVRFLSEKTCILVQPVIISRYLKSHISSRFFINRIKNELFLSKTSVIMSEQFALNHFSQQVLQSIQNVESRNVNLIFNCEVCNWKFTEQNYLDEHMLTHSEHLIIAEDEELEDGQYEIISEESEDLPNIAIEYPNDEVEESIFKKPNLQKENQTDHVCNDCDKQFTRKDFLEYHVQIQHKEFHCEYCSNVYKGEHAFKAHLKQHAEENYSTKDILKGIDQNQNNSKRSHPSSSRSKASEKVKKIKNDYSHVANDSSNLKCSYCTYEFKLKTEIDEHVLLCHSNTTNFKRYDSNSSDVVSCSICNLTFTKRFHLDRHMPIHTHHIYQCSKCQGSFQFRKSFLKHLEDVHSGFQEKGFYNNLKFNSGLAVGFRCGFCRFAAKARCTVDEHTYAEHYDEYSAKKDPVKREDDNKLEILPRKQSSSEQIKKIVPAYNSAFKFKCRFCGNAFLTIANRHRHEIDYHSSKGIVEKKSSQSNMKKIIDDLTSEVSTTFIACTKCPQIFTVQSMFENHLSSHQ